jgi:hypothetical protein
MPENTVQFLPFHAINEFMRPDFRLNVVRQTLSELNKLPAKSRETVSHQIRRVVKVPGFRNSEKAPTVVKVIPTAKAFESNPELVSSILSAWTELKSELRDQVFQVLKARQWFFFPDESISINSLPSLKNQEDWGVLPVAADRSLLPGFLIYWPKDQDFEAIYQTYNELYPDGKGSLDEVSLMSVWLANRLPYHITGDDEDAEPGSESVTEQTSN